MQDKDANNLLSLISAFDLDSVSWFVFVAAIVAQDHLVLDNEVFNWSIVLDSKNVVNLFLVRKQEDGGIASKGGRKKIVVWNEMKSIQKELVIIF